MRTFCVQRLSIGNILMKKTLIFIGIVFAVLVVALGYRNGAKSVACEPEDEYTEEVPKVEIRKSLFFNRDSVLYYAERAYKYDDPQGCFVVGACYYLRQQDPEFPEEIYVVSHADADTFLMISAAQYYQPAIDLIRCLHHNGCWNHEY